MTYGRKIFALCSLLIAVVGILVAAAVYFSAQSSLIDAVDDDLQNLALSSRSKLDPPDRIPFGSIPPSMPKPNDWNLQKDPNAKTDFLFPNKRFGRESGEIQVVDERGQIVQKNRNGRQALPVTKKVKLVASGDLDHGFETKKINGEKIRMYTRHVEVDGGVAVQSGRSLAEISNSLGNLKTKLIAIVIVASLFGGLGSLLLVYAMKKPLRELQSSMNRIKETQNLAQPLPVTGKDEISQLTKTFNGLIKEINHAHTKQTRFVADASHELRTPITVLRTNIEMLSNPKLSESARIELLDETEDEARQLTELVNALLMLSREEHFETQVTSLGELAEDAVERARRHFSTISFSIQISQPATVDLAPALFDRALDNLLKNAAQWTKAGVEIVVNQKTIQIVDHGPGIDEKDVHKIWDRFYRSRKARGKEGSGLGLALAKEAVEKSGAKINILQTPQGGATFQIVFD